MLESLYEQSEQFHKEEKAYKKLCKEKAAKLEEEIARLKRYHVDVVCTAHGTGKHRMNE